MSDNVPLSPASRTALASAGEAEVQLALASALVQLLSELAPRAGIAILSSPTDSVAAACQVLAVERLPQAWLSRDIAIHGDGLLARARQQPAAVVRASAPESGLLLPPEGAERGDADARLWVCGVITIGATHGFLALLVAPVSSRAGARHERAIELVRGVVAQLAVATRDNPPPKPAQDDSGRISLTVLRAQISRLLQLRDRERRHFAHDLDDTVTQSLVAMKYTLEHTTNLVHAKDVANAEHLLHQLVARLQNLLVELRALVSRIHPSVLDDFGGVSAVQWLCREWSEAHPQTRLVLECSVTDAQVPETLQLPLYRMVEEALENVARHAQAARVIVALAHGNGALSVEVIDEGVGFPAEKYQTAASPGLGLTGIRERVAFTGGNFTVISQPGRGAMLRAVWPLAIARDAEEPADDKA